MNIINMLPWYQWLILGLVPPLIFMLYFLKLRRVPLEVPSTYLWTKTVEDMHVNSIWQRLRRNLLLLLQILATLLLLSACVRPGCDGTQLAGDRFIFLVDQSASMSATDTEAGVSRLEASKKQIVDLIRNDLKPSDKAMVISFSDRAVVQQSYTTNKELLVSKVKSIKQTERGSDIKEALDAASGLANPGRTSERTNSNDVQVAEALAATMYIYSDGQFKDVPKFIFGNLSAEYRSVGTQIGRPANIGITAFSINDQMDSNGQVQVFARLLNSGNDDQDVGLSLFVDGELQDARNVLVPGRGEKDIANRNSVPLQFDLTAFAEDLEVAVPIRLEIDDEDIYMQDNVAHTVLSPAQMAKILVVSDYKQYLDFALSTEYIAKMATVEFEQRKFLETEEYQKASTLGFYDLIIFDQCAPEVMPSCNTVFWGNLPNSDSWAIEKELETTPIVDVDSNNSIMFGVGMGNVNIISGTVLKSPKGSTDLIESIEGPVMTIGPRGGFQDLVIGFPLMSYEDVTLNTDWMNNLSFPLFIQNVVVELASGSIRAARSTSPGEIVKVKTQVPYPEVDIANPESDSTTVKIAPDNSYVYSGTNQSGVYRVSESGSSETAQLFAVNLLDSRESNLEVKDEIKLGYEEIKRRAVVEPTRKDLWTWLALLALVVLTVEWYIYNRRVFI